MFLLHTRYLQLPVTASFETKLYYMRGRLGTDVIRETSSPNQHQINRRAWTLAGSLLKDTALLLLPFTLDRIVHASCGVTLLVLTFILHRFPQRPDQISLAMAGLNYVAFNQDHSLLAVGA
jgi:hypothetical protein